MQHVIGVDIGGTNLKLGLVESGNRVRILRQSSLPVARDVKGRAIVEQVVASTRELLDWCGVQVTGVGVGCPGQVDHAGKVHKSPNLPELEGIKLQDELSGQLRLPVAVQNDANAAVLGEWRFGKYRELQNLVLLTLGTGVGGGVIADGKLLQGANNGAAELGHLKIEPGGESCGCGLRGCLEAYVGSAGIMKIARRHLDQARTSRLRSDSLDTKLIAEAASANDEVAKEILYDVGSYLGRGIGIILDVFDPEKVLLGGGASAAFKYLYPGIRESILQWNSFKKSSEEELIELVQFPETTGILGAAATFVDAQLRQCP